MILPSPQLDLDENKKKKVVKPRHEKINGTLPESLNHVRIKEIKRKQELLKLQIMEIKF